MAPSLPLPTPAGGGASLDGVGRAGGWQARLHWGTAAAGLAAIAASAMARDAAVLVVPPPAAPWAPCHGCFIGGARTGRATAPRGGRDALTRWRGSAATPSAALAVARGRPPSVAAGHQRAAKAGRGLDRDGDVWRERFPGRNATPARGRLAGATRARRRCTGHPRRDRGRVPRAPSRRRRVNGSGGARGSGGAVGVGDRPRR